MTEADAASASDGSPGTGGPAGGGAGGPRSGTPPLIAGRYRLDDVLGSGSMGRVWRGWDELLRRGVAIKEVRLPAGLTQRDRDRLQERTMREARSAAQLTHHAVAAVYDVAEDRGHPWIVMQLVDGRSLDSVITVHGPMEPRRVAQLGVELLGALAAAHRAGVLHRDVKPSNVLLTTNGQAVLTDFGIAAIDGDPEITDTGIVVGTPAFMAPERIVGGAATPAADLWSLGATLYAAVEGKGPYDDHASATAAMAAILAGDPPPPGNAGPLTDVITGLLSRDPDRRPSVGDALKLLQEAVASPAPASRHRRKAPQSRRGPRPGGPRPASRRRLIAVVAAAVVCVAIAASASVLALHHAAGRHAPALAVRASRHHDRRTAVPALQPPSATPAATPASTPAPAPVQTHAAAPPAPAAARKKLVPAAGIHPGSWSGYTVKQGDSAEVTATFTVPVISCTSGEDGPGSAFWAGVQTASGTVMDGINDSCNSGGQPSYGAWMVPADNNPVIDPVSGTVRPGDQVTALVQEQGTTGQYLMRVTDHTQNWSQSATITGGSSTGDYGAVAAESYSGGADFSSVTVTGATVNGAPLGQSQPEADEQTPADYQGTAGLDPTALDASGENFSFFWAGQPGKTPS